MNKKFRFAIMAVALTAVFAACEKQPDPVDPTDDGILQGELTENKTLNAAIAYKLSGGYHVKAGATLTIPAGTKITAIEDGIPDYILIEPQAKINAQGTESNPIIMTAEREEAGAWAGIHICGQAPINLEGGKGTSEIGDVEYGGNNASDNSGIMTYVSIRYAGQTFGEDKEANGFTFYGVGNGTKLEYLEAYKGTDDGFEWFGGTVNVKYLISNSNSDDSFDWTQGWTGKGQFLVAYQEPKATLGYDCDALIEADNYSKNPSLTPISHPILSNLTLVGNNSDSKSRGARFRAGTQIELYNAIITGKTKSLTVETTGTDDALYDGTSKILNVCLQNTITNEQEGGKYTQTEFLKSGTNQINQTFSLTNNYVGTVANGVTPTDPFFTQVNFRGAVQASNDWTKNWSMSAQ